MYTIGKKVALTNILGRYLRIFLIFMGIALIIAACSKDEVEPKKDPPPKENPPVDGNQGGGKDTIVTPSDTLDADVVSQYLKLVNATKIPGQPPIGSDGDIKIDVKDTIFLMEGLPVGDRVSFLHDPALNVTGFYVYVPGSSYYYDVPSLPEEGRDSTDVVYIDAEFPVADFKDYPISFPIHLMPYVEGMPVKTSIRTVTIEKPSTGAICNDILRKRGGAINPYIADNIWQWESTLFFAPNREVTRILAPGLEISINSTLAGCCRNDGVSVDAGSGAGGCKKTNPAPNLTWVEFDAEDYLVRFYQLLFLWDDGEVEVWDEQGAVELIPKSRNFCTQTAEYEYPEPQFSANYGSHDFTPGANSMTMTFTNWKLNGPGIFFPLQKPVELTYTCHSLLMTWSDGEGYETGITYRKFTPDAEGVPELGDFSQPWFDN